MGLREVLQTIVAVLGKHNLEQNIQDTGGVTEWSRELKRHTREKQKLQNNCETFNYEQCCTG